MSEIEPVGEKLVVKPDPKERVTAGGIIIPETEAEKYDQAAVKATIVSVGPLAFQEEKKHEKEFGVTCLIPKAGDRITIAKYAGYNIELGSEKYRVIPDADVTAVLREET